MISKAIIYLLGTDPFYGHMLASTYRMYKNDDSPVCGVRVTDKVEMVINLNKWDKLPLIQQAEVLKHEMAHVMDGHCGNERLNQKEMDMGNNIAMDAAINEYLPNLPAGCVSVDNINKQLSKDNKMLKYSTYEYYYNKMQEEGIIQYVKGNPNDNQIIDDHEFMETSDKAKSITDQVIQKAVGQALKASGGIGSLSQELAMKVSGILKSRVNWKQELKQFFIRSVRFNKTKTRKRANRRYGILYPGRKKDYIAHIGVLVDSSGSMSGRPLELVANELFALSKQSNILMTVIVADCEVHEVYEFDKKKFQGFTGNGGTAYQPAITKAKELKVDGMIYLGDMDAADRPINPKVPFLWCITGEQAPPGDFGKIVRIKDDAI